MLAEPNLAGATGLPVGACRGGELPDFLNSISASKEYTLVYDLDLNKLGRDIKYDIDNSNKVKTFDRIAYSLELLTSSGEEKNLFVSMNAFTADVKKIGIPTFASQATFQTNVTSLDVFTNVAGVTSGTNIATGNIEFWPDNYSVENSAGVKGASAAVYDFGDEKVLPTDGYGSMQIHNYGAGQTLFAINHWVSGQDADLGIGNSNAQARDWTFSSNAKLLFLETPSCLRSRKVVVTKARRCNPIACYGWILTRPSEQFFARFFYFHEGMKPARKTGSVHSFPLKGLRYTHAYCL